MAPKKINRTSLQKVKVNLGTRSYSAVVGSGAIRELPGFLSLRKSRKSRRVFVISDEKLVEARSTLKYMLSQRGWQPEELPQKAGETLKDFNRSLPLFSWLLEKRANRGDLLIALGGGTIGDVAGFVAATYMRGLDWIGIPTTLLAQVDSSLGGKTGINHPQGKNLIGAFHQPKLVICDTDFLQTLSKREMISGFVEMLKTAIIYDPRFFSFLEEHQLKLLDTESDILGASIAKTLAWKARAVSRDEFDKTGGREVLNFGHTFGHALEAITDYSHFQHGEAVLWGMRFALILSNLKKRLSESQFKKIAPFVWSLPVPAIPPSVDFAQINSHMSLDKKVKDEKLRFVLVRGLGKAYSDSSVTLRDLQESYRMLIEGMAR